MLKNNSDLISAFLNKADKETFADKQDTLKNWASFSSDTIAKNSDVIDIEGERLTIAVYNSSVMQLIKFKESAILKKVNSQYPALKLKKIIYKQQESKKIASDDFTSFKPDLANKLEKDIEFNSKATDKDNNNDFDIDKLIGEIDELKNNGK